MKSTEEMTHPPEPQLSETTDLAHIVRPIWMINRGPQRTGPTRLHFSAKMTEPPDIYLGNLISEMANVCFVWQLHAANALKLDRISFDTTVDNEEKQRNRMKDVDSTNSDTSFVDTREFLFLSIPNFSDRIGAGTVTIRTLFITVECLKVLRMF